MAYVRWIVHWESECNDDLKHHEHVDSQVPELNQSQQVQVYKHHTQSYQKCYLGWSCNKKNDQ
jgi:uncharacterized protein YfbU (UPF0304 family)